ncbi:hypothetical protein LH128_17397 [Sphingomonas sp. LH128]|nr:hypothetical protein LH128_17397 [Sphingomonas sp. LH128]
MTIDPLERGARALAAAYNFRPDDSWSDQAYDTAPAMAPPEVPQQLPAWEHFKVATIEALRKCECDDPHATSKGSEDERIFEAMEGAGLVTAVYSGGETTTWALTEDGEEALRQSPSP